MFRLAPSLSASARSVAARRAAGVPQAGARRAYSADADATGDALLKAREATKDHAGHSAELWRKITFYVALPAIVVGYFNASSLAKEHESHLEHLKEENGGDLPERVVYPYMTKRDKEFPWGNYTLFYNSHVNLDPEASAE